LLSANDQTGQEEKRREKWPLPLAIEIIKLFNCNYKWGRNWGDRVKIRRDGTFQRLSTKSRLITDTSTNTDLIPSLRRRSGADRFAIASIPHSGVSPGPPLPYSFGSGIRTISHCCVWPSAK
jgi:hypothetical protein